VVDLNVHKSNSKRLGLLVSIFLGLAFLIIGSTLYFEWLPWPLFFDDELIGAVFLIFAGVSVCLFVAIAIRGEEVLKNYFYGWKD